jgi:hypothetical protein
MKRVISTLLICLLTLLLAAGPAMASTKAAGDPLRYFLYLNEQTGELNFLVLNSSGKTVDLFFPSGKDFDIEFRQNGKSVWRASSGQMYTLATRTEKFNSGTIKIFSAKLPKLNDGVYEVLAYFEGGLSRGLAVARMELKLGNPVKKGLDYSLRYDKAKNQVTFEVRNPGSQAADLTFYGGKQFDLIVYDKAGKKVWQESDGKFYTLAITNEKLASGSSKIYQSTLPVLQAGEYTVRAFFYGQGNNESVASFKVNIEAITVTTKLKFQAWYSGGRQPQIGLKVVNTSGDTVRLQLPTSQFFDIVIKDAKGIKWRYSDGKSFTQAQNVREFKPGATRYTFVYLPKLPQGNYTADIYHMGISVKPVATTSFTVR